MDTQDFQRWLEQLSQLTATQRATVQRVLRGHSPQYVPVAILPELPVGPHCQAPAAQLPPGTGCAPGAGRADPARHHG